jgi:hypothetical protein
MNALRHDHGIDHVNDAFVSRYVGLDDVGIVYNDLAAKGTDVRGGSFYRLDRARLHVCLPRQVSRGRSVPGQGSLFLEQRIRLGLGYLREGCIGGSEDREWPAPLSVSASAAAWTGRESSQSWGSRLFAGCPFIVLLPLHGCGD